jgi:hypothetical protein
MAAYGGNMRAKRSKVLDAVEGGNPGSSVRQLPAIHST